jgi:hypothetical protein
MLRGSGVHKGAEVNFNQKIDSHEDLPAKDIVDISVAGFEQKLEDDGLELSPEQAALGRDNVISAAKDEVVVMAKCHAEQQAPDYQPVLVEKYYRIELPNCSHDMSGIIDLLDDKYRVRDWKTSSRKKSQADVDASFQLKAYAVAIHSLTGALPSDVGLDTLVNTKKGCSRQVVTMVPTARDVMLFVARLNAVLDGINKGVFAPAPAGSWKCSSRWCGYAATDDCPYYDAERDETRVDLVNIKGLDS